MSTSKNWNTLFIVIGIAAILGFLIFGPIFSSKEDDKPIVTAVADTVKENIEEVSDQFPNKNQFVNSNNTPAYSPDFPRFYKVKEGESLKIISKKVYGTEENWKKIFYANEGSIDNWNLLKKDQLIILPKIN